MVKILTLKNRQDFVRAAKGLKVVCSSLIIQAAQTLPKKRTKKDKIFYSNEGTSTEHSARAYIEVREEASTGECPQDSLKTIFHLGFTATKKLGHAHVRNKTKRRLRAAAREVLQKYGLNGVDYVLIGRFNTKDIEFNKLKKDMVWGIKKINKMLLDDSNG